MLGLNSTTNTSTVHLYDQLMPQLLRNVNVENSSPEELCLINACRAHSEFGTRFPVTGVENWQAINSIEMFNAILPHYSRATTASGYIALARQCAQMTNDTTTLQKRVDLNAYLDQNQSKAQQLDKIVSNASLAEQTFTTLFKTVSEEEQLQLDEIHAQLYFSSFGLDRLNESSLALEVGPRLNQLHTAAWCTIPPIIASAIHKQSYFWAQQFQLNIEVAQLEDINYKKNNRYGWYEYNSDRNGNPKERHYKNYQDYVAKKEAELQHYKTSDEFKDIPSFIKETAISMAEKNIELLKKHASITNEQRNEEIKAINEKLKTLDASTQATPSQVLKKLQEELKKKDKKTLTDDEKIIIGIDSENHNASPATILAMTDLKVWFKNIPKPLAQEAFKEGVGNLPSFAYDAVTKFPIYAVKTVYHHTTQQPLYHSQKELLIANGWDKDSFKTKLLAGATTGYVYFWVTAAVAFYPYMLYRRYHSTKTLLDLIHEKQKELLTIGHLVKSMHMVHKIIENDSTLRNAMSGEYQKFAELFDMKNSNTSADLKTLISSLLSSSFQGNDSYFCSQEGKILATHHLLTRIKGQLVPYLEAFGQVDAYLAISKLHQEFKHHPRVQFCLPEFVNGTTPVLDVQGYWHPLIDANKVVPNDLSMGHSSNNANLIITGPNAGGKTTSLMSLIINIIFAQSFGIAPSSSLRITPFAKIHSYLDITTNLQEGLSLFAAEVDRAKKLKQSISSCLPGQLTFTIIDEIFSGTDPKVASEVGFTFASQLGEMNHSMTIITTHFPALTELETKTKRFTNYKVAATINADGSIYYPFKLIPGISTQNIAHQMLHNQGIL